LSLGDAVDGIAIRTGTLLEGSYRSAARPLCSIMHVLNFTFDVGSTICLRQRAHRTSNHDERTQLSEDSKWLA
jgi:hypothetical protein